MPDRLFPFVVVALAAIALGLVVAFDAALPVVAFVAVAFVVGVVVGRSPWFTEVVVVGGLCWSVFATALLFSDLGRWMIIGYVLYSGIPGVAVGLGVIVSARRRSPRPRAVWLAGAWVLVSAVAMAAALAMA